MAKTELLTGIYRITNNINNKIYIGKSKDILTRWQRHKQPSYQIEKDQAIHKAFIKYGIENFSFEIVELCDISIINEREQYWINFYDSYNKGYNCSLGGDGNPFGKSILTVEQVLEIKKMLKEGFFPSQIHEKFSMVSLSAIYDISTGRTWKNIQYNEEIPIVNRIDPRGQNNRKVSIETENQIIELRKQKKTIPQIHKELSLENIITYNGIYAIINRRNKGNKNE